MTFPTGYTKYQEITIDKDKVDATLTDFPVFIDLSDLDKTTDIFDTCRSDGGDIRVTLSDGTTQIAREIVSIDTSGKTGELHVKIPSLVSGTDTVIRVWYNGTDTEPAEDSTYGKEATWNSDYKMVQHMDDATTSTVVGSTSNGSVGTKYTANQPPEGAGLLSGGTVGKAQNFGGTATSDFIELNKPDTGGYSALTVSAISKLTSGTNKFLVANWGAGDEHIFFLLQGGVRVQSGGTEYNATSAAISSDTIGISYLTFGNSEVISYTNGVAGSAVSTGALLENDNFDLDINRAAISQTLAFNGLIDEIRMLNVTLTPSWISTEYNNQSSPSTFYSASTEQTSGGSTYLPIKFNHYNKNIGT